MLQAKVLTRVAQYITIHSSPAFFQIAFSLELTSFGFSFELENPNKMISCLCNILKLTYLYATNPK